MERKKHENVIVTSGLGLLELDECLDTGALDLRGGGEGEREEVEVEGEGERSLDRRSLDRCSD